MLTKISLKQLAKEVIDKIEAGGSGSVDFTIDDSLVKKEDGKIGVALPTRALTSEEYEALSEAEKLADVEYIITDDTGNSGGGSSSIPKGVIWMWAGSIDEIPEGWALCDGENDTPDLRDRFVLSAGTTHAIGEIGGEAQVTLSAAQIPYHTHSTTFQKGGTLSSTSDASTYSAILSRTSGANVSVSSSSIGSGGAHNNMPPYYTLAFIMKL